LQTTSDEVGFSKLLVQQNSFIFNSVDALKPLFAQRAQLVLFLFNNMRTLFQKHPGWGYPFPSES
jgi:hypothetical protein